MYLPILKTRTIEDKLMNYKSALALTITLLSTNTVLAAETPASPDSVTPGGSLTTSSGDACGAKKIKKVDRDICDILKKPEDIKAEDLPFSLTNPFGSGCDFSSLSFPGLPEFGYNLASDTLCSVAESIVNPMIDGLNDKMQEQTDLIVDKVTGGYGTQLNIDLTQDAIKNGSVIGTSGSTSGGSSTLNQTYDSIMNAAKGLQNEVQGNINNAAYGTPK